MYLIFLQEEMYQSGTPASTISFSSSGVRPFPFRTISMILKASEDSTPYLIRASMMESRVPMTVEIVQVPFAISSCAFPVQTSVPWDNPETWSRSAKDCGRDSCSIWMTNRVPSSGSPSVPKGQLISSGVMPSGSVPKNRS